MASLSYFVCALSLFFSFTFLHSISCNAHYFFIFGDSLYDPGNNQYITTDPIPSYYPPYGTTFFNHSTGRFSDGRVVADFIAVNLNLPWFIPPAFEPEAEFVNGANFASAGAGVFKTDYPTISFGEQVDRFTQIAGNWTKEFGAEEANAMLSSAVYLISISGDDYFSFATQNPNATVTQQQEYVDLVLAEYKKEVQRIYDIGGRKFMLQNVAPIGCLPMMKQSYNVSGNACAGKPLTIAELHNAALPIAIRELKSTSSGFIYSIFDYFTAIGNRINNPTAYEFKFGDVACCGVGTHRSDDCGSDDGFELCFDPNEYVFFDGGHNTDKANYQMADLMWTGKEDAVSSLTMRQLFELETVTKISSRKTLWPLRSKIN